MARESRNVRPPFLDVLSIYVNSDLLPSLSKIGDMMSPTSRTLDIVESMLD